MEVGLRCVVRRVGSPAPGSGECRRLPPSLDELFERGTLPAHTIAPVLDVLRATAARRAILPLDARVPRGLSRAGRRTDRHRRLRCRHRQSAVGDAARRSRRRANARRRQTERRRADVFRPRLRALPPSGRRPRQLVSVVPRADAVAACGTAAGSASSSRGASPPTTAPRRLRRRLLDRTAIDTLISLENHDRLFPIHRSLRFLLLCTTAGAPPTESLPCRFGVRHAGDLERLPELGTGSRRDRSATASARAHRCVIAGDSRHQDRSATSIS